MKVLFLVAYSELAASSRTRVYDYLPFLKKVGIEYKCICFTPSYLHDLTSQRRGFLKNIFYYIIVFCIKWTKIFHAIVFARMYDIIFIQKIIFPFGFEFVLKLINRNIIFDFDDAIFTNEDIGSGIIAKLKNGFQAKGFVRMLRAAKCCLVENKYNKNIALKYCPIVEIITGPINTEKYFIKNRGASQKVVVGWTGSPSTAQYLFEIKNALTELSQKYDIIFRFMGVGKKFKMEEINFQREDWSLEKEVSIIQTFDIGIMPLPDNKWTRGKGGYKLLQYMACGVPAVASPVEINKEIISNGVDGFLANNTKEWVEKMSTLIKDPGLREKMGNLAREKIEDNYSLITASEKLLKIFQAVLAR